MTFELRTERAPAGLADLGQNVEIRELPYGAMRDAMAASEKPGQSADRLLAASLHVDGAPLGFDALQGLPGRFAGAISEAMRDAMRMHGLSTGDDEADDADAPKG